MSTDPTPLVGMTLAEAGRILAVAIVLDPRLPQPDAQGFIRGVWHDALKALPFQSAYDAVIAYYSSEEYRKDRNSIAPADIVAGVRKLRSVGNAPPYKALPGPDPATEETREQLMADADAVFRRLAETREDRWKLRRLFAMPFLLRRARVRNSPEDERRRAEAEAELQRVRERGAT